VVEADTRTHDLCFTRLADATEMSLGGAAVSIEKEVHGIHLS
jgi:hypothetical protein